MATGKNGKRMKAYESESETEGKNVEKQATARKERQVLGNKDPNSRRPSTRSTKTIHEDDSASITSTTSKKNHRCSEDARKAATVEDEFIEPDTQMEDEFIEPDTQMEDEL